MPRTYRLNLADIPWPASILKCHNLLDVMKPCDALDVTLKDGNVFKNLVLLFGALPGTELTARHAAEGYEIHLVKMTGSATVRSAEIDVRRQ
ncbi:MAG: hypothetical protein ABIL58_25365 [Pseudomonadota bacterium]